MRITRRHALATGSALAFGTAATVATSDIRPMSPAERIKQVLRSELDYLDIPEAVLDAFIRDYKTDPLYSRFVDFGRRSYGARTAAQKLGVLEGGEDTRRMERHLIAYFLQSTDFFTNGGNSSRPLRYTRYWDPYKLGCANPFATLSL